PPMYGLFVRNASPGLTSPPHFSSTDSSANCISPSCAGMCSESSTMRLSAVNSSQLKSCISRMIGEYDERYSTTAISSAMWWDALARISCVIGSSDVGATFTLPPLQHERGAGPDPAAPARRDDDRGVLLLDDR